ncbi:hypothetical protein M0R04_13050 [Candidatus Dojkabacteria bacterium]|jgi:hypothetical protein|nr:hypothetical protein [Candidatus Dojkabacteria bacterium]
MAKLRVSSSVIGFKEKAERTWGLKEWDGVDDPDTECVFFGLYHERDFAVFEMDFTKRIVFWCGSDITRVISDYERRRILKNYPETEHYCENEIEQTELHDVGIEAKIVPSFLDDVNSYQPTFKVPEDGKWKVWLCAHPAREDEYGLALAKRWAEKDPQLEFHVYGINKGEKDKDLPNVIYHGKVPEAQLNEEIKGYQAGFRPNFHDGFSEVTAKSVLNGQYPITRIKYADIWNYETEHDLRECWDKLKTQTQPNPARELYLTRFNNFPFVCKQA